MMGITNYALDTFAAQEMSKLKHLSIISLADDFPSAHAWLAQLVLSRIFHGHVPDEKAALAFAIVRRTHAALQEWELASAAAKGNLRSVGNYFSILRHVESCISSTWQALEFGRKPMGEVLFTKEGEHNVYKRLNWVYNVSRHFDPQALPQGDLHRTWLSDDAIHTREHLVLFAELRDVIAMLGRISNHVSGLTTTEK
ncbi:hypothetical protein [Massilia sp. TN1-12]|uniref:hypothetical protein n=1 Tax=Massilia paldalensis TaxID=3377675 RepID=UPI00384C44B8